MSAGGILGCPLNVAFAKGQQENEGAKLIALLLGLAMQGRVHLLEQRPFSEGLFQK
jgi:hypothetical protein